MDISEVHHTRGKICTYTLELENDKWWVGYSTDLEKRISQHMGKAPGGAQWTRFAAAAKDARIK